MRSLFTIIAITATFFVPNIALSQVSLPWSCDFDSCPDWVQGQTLNCCGLSLGGGWTCNGTGEEINSTDPWGGTGKSQLHYAGPGTNIDSGGLRITFTGSKEIYVRYYIKYQPGFTFSSVTYDKHLYINQGLSNHVVCEPAWDDQYQCTGNGFSENSGNGYGWASVFSDHAWHYVEVHLKWGTSTAICEVWIDGKKVVSHHNFAAGSDSDTFSEILIGSNQSSVGGSTCKYRSFDNLAIATTGPIGSAPGGVPPSPPQNLRIQ